jgi:hypothetical protein
MPNKSNKTIFRLEAVGGCNFKAVAEFQFDEEIREFPYELFPLVSSWIKKMLDSGHGVSIELREPHRPSIKIPII